MSPRDLGSTEAQLDPQFPPLFSGDGPEFICIFLFFLSMSSGIGSLASRIELPRRYHEHIYVVAIP